MKYNIRRFKNDWLVVIGIIGVFVTIYGFTVFGQVSRIKEQTLIFELKSLRNAVAAFHYVNGRNPKDLDELASSSFTTSRGTKKYYLSKDLRERDLLDPFGRPYLYNRKRGWVKSSTESYKEW